jgi:hypothetical protein
MASGPKWREYDLTFGAEVEAHTITLSNLKISRRLTFPPKRALEKSESYHHDRSIGIEYASRPYRSIREALFGIKGGLRKCTAEFHFDRGTRRRNFVLFFTGTWRDHFAGTHFHAGLGPEGIEFEDAEKLSRHLHGHLPFLIALLANSPVYQEQITYTDSNRFVEAHEKYFDSLEPGVLDREMHEEMTFNKSRKKRVPTLEVRPCDANLPEYMAAGMVVIKAVTMAWLARRPVANENSFENHVKARNSAGRRGARARLYWNNRPVTAARYLDRFFKAYAPYLKRMDIPSDVIYTFGLFKQGWNGATILRNTCLRHQRAHPRIWRRLFAEEYAEAVTELVNGDSLYNFARRLGLRPPRPGAVRIGDSRWS